MKEVKLTLNGKNYVKSEPTVQDWYDSMDATEPLKAGVGTKKGLEAYFNVVSKYLGAPIEEIRKHEKLKDVTDAFQQINANLSECFYGSEEDSKN